MDLSNSGIVREISENDTDVSEPTITVPSGEFTFECQSPTSYSFSTPLFPHLPSYLRTPIIVTLPKARRQNDTFSTENGSSIATLHRTKEYPQQLRRPLIDTEIAEILDSKLPDQETVNTGVRCSELSSLHGTVDPGLNVYPPKELPRTTFRCLICPNTRTFGDADSFRTHLRTEAHQAKQVSRRVPREQDGREQGGLSRLQDTNKMDSAGQVICTLVQCQGTSRTTKSNLSTSIIKPRPSLAVSDDMIRFIEKAINYKFNNPAFLGEALLCKYRSGHSENRTSAKAGVAALTVGRIEDGYELGMATADLNKVIQDIGSSLNLAVVGFSKNLNHLLYPNQPRGRSTSMGAVTTDVAAILGAVCFDSGSNMETVKHVMQVLSVSFGSEPTRYYGDDPMLESKISSEEDKRSKFVVDYAKKASAIQKKYFVPALIKVYYGTLYGRLDRGIVPCLGSTFLADVQQMMRKGENITIESLQAILATLPKPSPGRPVITPDRALLDYNRQFLKQILLRFANELLSEIHTLPVTEL